MDWQLAAQREDAASLSGTVYRRLRGLIRQRAALPALAASQPLGSIALDDSRLFALTRGDDFVAVHNFGEQPLTVELAALGGDRWTMLADGSEAATESLGDAMRLVLPAYAVRWLERVA